MDTFVWTMAILLGIEGACAVVCLASRTMQERTPGGMALSAIVNVGLLLWAATLLATK